MKKQYLLFAVCSLLVAPAAQAAVPYRVEQTRTPVEVEPGTTNDDEAFARIRRFYIGGGYHFSMWNGDADDNAMVDGRNTSGFEAMVGVRIYDTFRLEANYINSRAEWDMPAPAPMLELSSNTIMANAIWDARIDSLYRVFRKQRLVPYVGAGFGISMNKASGTKIENKNTPVAAAMAGLGIELGDRFTIDFGYRYTYMFTPKFDVIKDLAPTAHQLRAGVRVNF
ncbi:MAG: porin family protein [Rickettsiales bacterium]|jgi:opacity protein-like surface antigen|nr:porin family protein [Rickettsiales bacterium]